MTSHRSVKRYKPSKLWVIVADDWPVRKLGSAGLGVARGAGEATDRLYGTCFVACFHTRALAKWWIRQLPEKWDGLRVIPVLLTECPALSSSTK